MGEFGYQYLNHPFWGTQIAISLGTPSASAQAAPGPPSGGEQRGARGADFHEAGARRAWGESWGKLRAWGRWESYGLLIFIYKSVMISAP